MNPPKITEFKAGALQGMVYLFESSGDILEEHYHPKNEGHVTFVIQGSVKIESKLLENNWTRTGKAGDFFDLPDDQWHEITALENNTKILNILKGVLA
jgi:quercetin dioxygenase-like cupin family protein